MPADSAEMRQVIAIVEALIDELKIQIPTLDVAKLKLSVKSK